MTSNETIEPGKTSNIFIGKAPASGNVNDVEVLKYKISLSRGVYMEYDVKSRQYNWIIKNLHIQNLNVNIIKIHCRKS